jgi:hypothetical protein
VSGGNAQERNYPFGSPREVLSPSVGDTEPALSCMLSPSKQREVNDGE